MKQISLLPEPDNTPLALERIDVGAPVWGCDYGSGYFHVWNGTYQRLTPDEFASLKFASAGDVVVIENAHMQPKKKSLAQVYDIEQLFDIKQIAEERGILVRLWFHSQTPKWRSMLGMGDKSDEVDAQTVFEIVQRIGLVGLQRFNPRREYPERIQWAHEQIEDMNNWLNNARMDYDADNCQAFNHYVQQARAVIQQQILWSKRQSGLYSDELIKDCNYFWLKAHRVPLDEHKNGLSLWAAFVASDGTVRRFKGQLPGVKFVMQELLRQRPNHFRGGVARSNIMWHSFKNEAIAHLKTRKKKEKQEDKTILPLHKYTQAQMEQFLQYRRRFRKSMVVTLHAMREYLLERSVV